MITAYFASLPQCDSLPQCEMANNAGDGRMSFISRRDCATAAAYALANRFLHTEVLNINGAESLTMADFAAIGNEVTGNRRHGDLRTGGP